jgi:hypothetical protein
MGKLGDFVQTAEISSAASQEIESAARNETERPKADSMQPLRRR